VALDLVAADGPAQLVQRAIDDHGRVDVLVNNVGAVRLRLDGFLGTAALVWLAVTVTHDGLGVSTWELVPALLAFGLGIGFVFGRFSTSSSPESRSTRSARRGAR
jgi:NAD(P)-dependent dehydrogenase (short-subunit alcohol dehydrogenase family)